MSHPLLVHFQGLPRTVAYESDVFGLPSYHLVGAPRRLFADHALPPLYEPEVDVRRVESMPSPAELLGALPAGDNWHAMSMRTQALLSAAFLLAEDPQRRLDARKVELLMHQVSLVHHILSGPKLRRVLIADEVGLGKTIEAGLILKRVLDERPGARALYLAPARLVGNVVNEFREKLDLDARKWVAGVERDARLDDDRLIVASIHKAVTTANFEVVAKSGPWDVIVVDECHHLSDWGQGGGDPNQSYRLVSRLIENLSAEGRLILMSGTPHQGNQTRFENILKLLQAPGETLADVGGRVIYRTKDRVTDWQGRPLFPRRDVRPPRVIELGSAYEAWYQKTADLYDGAAVNSPISRATGWAKGQALQWVASSAQAGLGFLVRLAIRRLAWTHEHAALAPALEALRPYRGGSTDEPIAQLYGRLARQVALIQKDRQFEPADDAEAVADGEEAWRPDPDALAQLLSEGVELVRSPTATRKWDAVADLIREAVGEKVVLFAQPVETVSVVARFLEAEFGCKPAIIIGDQSEQERREQVASFRRPDGPRFLVSSRAGGEGLNMQMARRLIHLDVPWNPMELEQRIGRVHRFGSRRTVLIDTVVVAGTREVDAYRIARQKLALIVQNLDAEQFEVLFSRVMALVPPQELESVIGGAVGSTLNVSAAAEIERLVRQGYAMWSAFNEAYRAQEEQIRALDPGAATWADIQRFLLDHGGAKPADDVGRQLFRLVGEDVEAVEDTVPAIALDGQIYACSDSGGLLDAVEGDRPPALLGLNLPEVAGRLCDAFHGGKPAGAAFLRLDAHALPVTPMGDQTAVIGFLCQKLRQERGQYSEMGLSLKLFLVSEGGDPMPLSAGQASEFVRHIIRARRQRDPKPTPLAARLVAVERTLSQTLRRPSDAEFAEGIRYGVWPVLAAVISVNS